MTGFEKLRDRKDDIEKKVEEKIQLGNAYEANKEQYERMYGEIYSSEMDAGEKHQLLSQIAEYQTQLQRSYEENVQKPIEEQQLAREQMTEETTKNLNGIREAFGHLDMFHSQAGVDTRSIDMGKKEMSDSAKRYEEMKKQALQQQQLTLQRLQNQRNQIMRDSLRK